MQDSPNPGSNQLNIGNLIFGTGLGSSNTISTGNLGIGTTTPWGKLSITGSGTGTGLAFAIADSANTPRFVIQDNGNVGIGTTTPTNKLHIYDTTSLYPLVHVNSTSLDAAMEFYDGTNAVFSGLFGRLKLRTGWAVVTGGNCQFLINTTGNLGIGTTTPWGKLSVKGSGTGTGLAFAVADMRTRRASSSKTTATSASAQRRPPRSCTPLAPCASPTSARAHSRPTPQAISSVSSDERLKNIDGGSRAGLPTS